MAGDYRIPQNERQNPPQNELQNELPGAAAILNFDSIEALSMCCPRLSEVDHTDTR